MFRSESLSFDKDDILQLYGMLSSKRPAKSSMESRFIQHYLTPLGVERDAYGNIWKRIGDLPVAWSCHTDTVHKDDGYQTLVLKGKRTIKLHKDEGSNCLGADDTAGVWLMVQMIQKQRPGLYVFHREEEIGGKGSRWAATNAAKRYDGIECMIALDRRGKDSVITQQAGGRCCSDEFGNSLAAKLNQFVGFKYRLDTGGSFTDSANYTDIIAECTNLSVGYYNQHWKDESLDLNHILSLRQTLLDLDFRDLTIKRKPGEKDPVTYRSYKSEGWANGHGVGNWGWDEYEGDGYPYGHAPRSGGRPTSGFWQEGKWHPKGETKQLPPPAKKSFEEVYFRMANGKRIPDTVLALIQDYPLQMAAMMEEWGFSVGLLREEITERLGPKRAVRGGKAYQQVINNDNREDPKGTPP